MPTKVETARPAVEHVSQVFDLEWQTELLRLLRDVNLEEFRRQLVEEHARRQADYALWCGRPLLTLPLL